MSYNPFARGAFPVGVRTITLGDEARDGRTVTIELWYPAAERHRGEDLRDDTRDRFTVVPGFDATQQAVRDADTSEGRFPLIAYSDGWSSDRRDAADHCTHLASHGYVIASADHLGDQMGELAAKDSAETFADRVNSICTNRIGDLIFVIDRALDGGDPAIAQLIDRERIGTAGASFGGWTSIAMNSYDRRPKAVFALVPAWGKGPLRSELLQAAARLDDWQRAVPVFLLASERDACIRLEGIRELYRELPGPKYLAVVAGASHFHFANKARERYELALAVFNRSIADTTLDFAAMAAAMPPFWKLCSAERALTVAKALFLAHMDAELKANVSARAFLNADLRATVAARGINLEVVKETSDRAASV